MPSLGMNLHGAPFRCQATAATTETTQEIQLFPNPNLTTTSHGRPYVSMAMGQTGICSPQVPAKPLTEGELCDWIASALVGESIQYHEGLLFIDRSSTTSTLTIQQRNRLHATARRAWIACELGLIHLFSQKVSERYYRYIAVRASSGMTPSDIRPRLRNANHQPNPQGPIATQE